jgi:hypothetical protein
VRIAVLIAEGMVLAMLGDPGERGTFTRQSAEKGQEPADGAVGLETLVREQSMVPHAYPKTACGERQNDAGPECGPTEEKRGDDRQDMHNRNPNNDRPVHPQLLEGLLAAQIGGIGRVHGGGAPFLERSLQLGGLGGG